MDQVLTQAIEDALSPIRELLVSIETKLETLIIGHSIDSDDVTDVFDYWKLVHKKSSSTKLSEKRRSKITRALKRLSKEECYQAIDGCKLSEFHMGSNPNGVKYNDIELIFRDDSKIDKFLELYESNNNAATNLEQWVGS